MHLIRLAAGLCPDPLGGELNSTRETPALRDREQVLKKVGQNVGDRKEKGKEKFVVNKDFQKHRNPPKFDSIITPALDV